MSPPALDKFLPDVNIFYCYYGLIKVIVNMPLLKGITINNTCFVPRTKFWYSMDLKSNDDSVRFAFE